jgi:deoxyribonuclease IV
MGTAGGLHNACHGSVEVGCELFQVFTKNPQQWAARPQTDDEIEVFLSAQETTGIRCIASHDTYLINPASEKEDILAKSRAALVDEVQRCARLKIPYVVMHQGAQGDATEAEALFRLAESVRITLDAIPDGGPMLLLETTAGQGKTLGWRFEQMAAVFEGVGDDPRLGICLDTCHLFAAGYDLRDEPAYTGTMALFDRLIGLKHVHLIHANDSKRELGARVDRHEHIGQGHIGIKGFELLLCDPRLTHVPVLLETPKKDDMDPVNLKALRQAAGIIAAVMEAVDA